jgi:glycerol-3-phosphate acyltransferase PlsY
MSGADIWGNITWALAGYLSGSIPFGLLLTRMAGLGDVRAIGSGNIGATNVLRTGSKKLAAATLLLDMLKGLAPVLAARLVSGDAAALVAAAGAFAGHVFPLWLKFRGGKGVATYLGILLGLAWQLALVFIATWITIAFFSRISSLAALLAVIFVIPAAFVFDLGHLAFYLAGLAFIIWLTHKSNIARLISGKETRINLKGGT